MHRIETEASTSEQAITEAIARIKQILSIQVPDEAVAGTATPAVTVAAVNELLTVGVA